MHLTLGSGINVGVCLLIFGLFSSGYVLIKGGTFINFFIFYLFNIFLTFFPSAMYKKIKLSVILRGGYAYSRGYVYCFSAKKSGWQKTSLTLRIANRIGSAPSLGSARHLAAEIIENIMRPDTAIGPISVIMLGVSLKGIGWSWRIDISAFQLYCFLETPVIYRSWERGNVFLITCL